MSLFKITRGGQAEPVKTPKQFAQFDVLQAMVDRDTASFLRDRDKIARKLKAKYGLLPQGRFVPELAALNTMPTGLSSQRKRA